MKLENGMYIKAQIRAIRFREVLNKKTGELMQFYSVIVEESAERDKRELQLSKAAIQKRLDVELDKLVGKVCMIPFYISFNNNYLNLHYAGSDLPIVVPQEAQKPQVHQGAA